MFDAKKKEERKEHHGSCREMGLKGKVRARFYRPLQASVSKEFGLFLCAMGSHRQTLNPRSGCCCWPCWFFSILPIFRLLSTFQDTYLTLHLISCAATQPASLLSVKSPPPPAAASPSFSSCVPPTGCWQAGFQVPGLPSSAHQASTPAVTSLIAGQTETSLHNSATEPKSHKGLSFRRNYFVNILKIFLKFLVEKIHLFINSARVWLVFVFGLVSVFLGGLLRGAGFACETAAVSA